MCRMIKLNLRERITLFKEVEVRTNGFMGLETKELVTVSAEYNPMKGDEVIKNGEMSNIELVNFVVRYRKTIDTSIVVEYNGSKYNVICVTPLGTKEAMKLLCRKI